MFRRVQSGLVAALSLLVTLTCAYSIRYKSALKWTFEQPQYHQAIIELVLLFLIIFATVCLLRGKRKRQVIVLMAESLTFCFLHAYFVAIVVGAVYAFEIYLLGRTINRYKMPERLKKNFWMCIVSGMSGQIILVGIASLLRVGTAEKLRWIIAVLFVFLLYMNRTVISDWMKRIASSETEKEPCFENKLQIGLFAAICVLFLLQVGRANISLDFDSVWYGLRSEYMLAPETGIYDKVISSVLVYAYSKGIEILSLPFSGLSSLGIVYVTNLFLGLGILKCSYDICRLNLTKTMSLLVTVAIAATPGIMNMTITAKSDIPSTFLQMVMIYFALRAVQSKNADWHGAAIATGVLSFAFKSTTLVFSSVVMAVCLLFWIFQKGTTKIKNLGPMKVCATALAFVWGRTIYLAGLPSDFIFPVLYRKLDIPLNYPYQFSGTASGFSQALDFEFLTSRIPRFLDTLFLPTTTETDHIIIAWGGLLFVIVGILSVFGVIFSPSETMSRIKSDSGYSFLLMLFILISGISAGAMLVLAKPDGNYFQLWYALTFIFAAYEFEKLDTRNAHNTLLSLVLPVVVFQFFICMATSWSWSLGLTPIDISRLGYYNNREETRKYMQTVDMGDIYTALEEQPNQRVMVFTNEVRKLMIPASADAWFDVFRWGNHVTKSNEEFLKYIQTAEIDKLVLNIDYLFAADHSLQLVEYLAEQGYLEIDLIEGENALVTVRRLPAEPDQKLLSYLGASATVISGHDSDGWARKQTVIQLRNQHAAELKITVYYPLKTTGNEVITAFLDGEPMGEFVLTESLMVLTIPIETAGTHELVLNNPFAFAATPPDIRQDLSYIISNIVVEEID